MHYELIISIISILIIIIIIYYYTDKLCKTNTEKLNILNIGKRFEIK